MVFRDGKIKILGHRYITIFLNIGKFTSSDRGSYPNSPERYTAGSKCFRPDQLFKVTEIKQIFYFST